MRPKKQKRFSGEKQDKNDKRNKLKLGEFHRNNISKRGQRKPALKK
jgi:hypothetical protein